MKITVMSNARRALLGCLLAGAAALLAFSRQTPRKKLWRTLGIAGDIAGQEVLEAEDDFCRAPLYWPLVLPQANLNCSRLRMNLEGKPAGAYYLVAKQPADQTPERRPAVVILHGHLSQASDLVGTTTSTMVWPVARLMAHHGFAVLAPQDRWDSDYPLKESRHALRLLVTGKALAGERTADALRWIRYLKERPDIDPKRIGVMGWSMGGDIALYASALEPGVKMVYLSSTMSSFYDLTAVGSALQTADNYVPSVLKNFTDKVAIAALIYPRPFLIEHGTNDEVRPFERADHDAHYLIEIYGSKAPSRLYFLSHQFSHKFYGGRAVLWFQQWL
ncbi:MAG: dienelactone hydrolase family protein [Elusimicrobia bacterium]|nr:dienelactone hydrolase family protein [Elusimicrobiota bacterium]